LDTERRVKAGAEGDVFGPSLAPTLIDRNHIADCFNVTVRGDYDTNFLVVVGGTFRFDF
jgi:hypothetical protein